MYVVIIWGDYTQAVPISWVDEQKKILKWPPKDVQPGVAIKKQLKPGKNWEQITYTKIVHRCETLEEAKQMELEATYLSTDGSLHADKTENQKRKIKRPNMEIFDTNFVPPDRYVSVQTMDSEDYKGTSPAPGDSQSQDILADLSSGDDECIENDTPSGTVNNDILSQDFFVEPSKKSTKIALDTIPCPCHIGMKKVFQELSRLRRDVEDFTRRTSTATQSRDYSLLPRFPLTMARQLQQFEEVLLDNNAMQLQFKSKIMGIGGRDLPHNLRNILKLIMTNSVATQFTWTGAKSPNMAIRGTKFITLIFEVLQVTYPQATVDNMEGITREWFRHASDRLKKQSG